MPGDLLLLPTGIEYSLCSEPDVACRPFDRSMKEGLMTPEGDLTLDGPGAVTTFVCAGYDYDLDVAQPLMSVLPDVLHVPADPANDRAVAAIVELLAAEVGARRAGSRAAAARLIDLLLIAAIRSWVGTSRGWRPLMADGLASPDPPGGERRAPASIRAHAARFRREAAPRGPRARSACSRSRSEYVELRAARPVALGR